MLLSKSKFWREREKNNNKHKKERTMELFPEVNLSSILQRG